MIKLIYFITISIIVAISCTLCGCTIVNLAPPEANDGILQHQLEKHFSPSE